MFDPNAPIDVLDPPAAPATAAPTPKTFDPDSTVDLDSEKPPFDPNAPVDVEHPYVTKIRANTDLTPDEKQSRIDAFNQGLGKFDPDAPVTPLQRFTIHAKEAAGETLPALAVKGLQAFTEQPFQALPLPLRMAQGQLDALQREKDRRAGTLGDVMGDPTFAEYPDTVLDSELSKAQARVQKFMTPENVAAIRAEQTRLADIAAKSAGEKQSFENLPPATGFVQKGAAVAGEFAGGLTDPTNLIPLEEVDKTASLGSRLLTTGKNLAGQTAAIEPVRQTLAVAANEPDQTGASAAAQRVAGAFAAGTVLQGGSELLGKVWNSLRAPGLKQSDFEGKTMEQVGDMLAEKLGEDPATARAKAQAAFNASTAADTLTGKGGTPSTTTAGPAATERPVTDTLSLNPEDREVAIHPESPVEPAATAAPEPARRDFFTPAGRESGETEMAPDAKIEPAGPQPSAATEQQVTPETPPASPQVEPLEAAQAVQPAPATTAPAKGLISGSSLEKWANDTVSNYTKGTIAPMTGGIDLIVARAVQGAALLENGIRDFSKWSKEMIDRYGEELRPHLDNLYRMANAIHGEGDRAGNASSGDIKRLVSDFIPAKSGALNPPTPPQSGAGAMLNSILHGQNATINGTMNSLARKAAPRTSALSQDTGDALVRYAAAAGAAPEVARAHAGIVLGDHIHDPEFANRLGATMVEDRLRAIKAGLVKQAGLAAAAGDRATFQEFMDHAQNVTSLVGKKDSLFQTSADYDAALKDPEIQGAIARHKETVQPLAKEMHEQLGGQVAQSGIDTGAFVNLEARDEEGNPVNAPVGRGSKKGDLTNPLKKGSRFSQQAFGTADNYTTDYNELAKNMISGNYEEVAKQNLYDQITKDSLGVILPNGEKPPQINGLDPRKIQIERRGLPSAGGARTLVRNLWVDPRIYPELVRGMNLDETFPSAGMQHLGSVLGSMQGPVVGALHIRNLVSGIAGSQGGPNMVADLAKAFPKVNVTDALTRIGTNAVRIIRDDAGIRSQVADLAKMGAMRSPFAGGNYMSRFIGLVDKAARVGLDNMYQSLVERGLAEDSTVARREFINSHTGQYNPRLMGQISAKLKDLKLSPYIVAGQTFYANGLRQVTGSPGVKAASTGAAVALRAVQLGTLATSLIVMPRVINYLISGKPEGPDGTKFGEIGYKTADGKLIRIDPNADTGVRRGLMETGADALISGNQRGDSAGKIGDAMFKQAAGSLIHPMAGPLVNAAVTLATGYNSAGFRQSSVAKPGQSQTAQNALSAAAQLNPMVGGAVEGYQRGGTKNDAMAGFAKPLLSMANVKVQGAPQAVQQVRDLAGHFNDSLGIPRDSSGQVSQYSNLTTAIHGQDMDKAQSALGELLTQKAGQVPGNRTDATKAAIAKREVLEYFQKEANAPFTGSQQREREFKKTLDADDAATYQQALTDRRQALRTVRALLYGH